MTGTLTDRESVVEDRQGTQQKVATLSVVIPVYNEKGTWRELLNRVLEVPLEDLQREIILVDDGSSDGTRDELRQFEKELNEGRFSHAGSRFQIIFQQRNAGKGAALRTGFQAATGDMVIIQDADLEYDPGDYSIVIRPILEGEADVVYGSRFAEKGRKGYWKNYLANRFLTMLSNLTTGQKLTDMETCYKVFRREIIQSIPLEQNRFGFEPEVTAKLSKRGIRIHERPIRYYSRTHDEGKKIGWKDGVKAIWCIFKYGLRRKKK